MTAIISKMLIFIFTVASFFTVAQPENVKITVNEVTTESTAVGFTYENKTKKIMSELDSMRLYKSVDDEWEEVDLNYAMPEVAYRTYQNQKVKDSLPLTSYDWENGDGTLHYVKLTEGEYRLTITYRIYEFSKGWTKATASTTFTVER
ncbi:MAG: hypothetical protein IKJ27_07580 [Clostridia bacterium]|nr:hypothetical protein [Clostridia bacterium]